MRIAALAFPGWIALTAVLFSGPRLRPPDQDGLLSRRHLPQREPKLWQSRGEMTA